MKYILRIGSIITVLFTVLIIIYSSTYLEAADVTLVKEYKYQASEADSKISSRAIALEQIKRILLEELGTFLISETEVKDFQLTKDQIVTYTAGSVITVILQEKWDGQTYYMQAKLTANPNEVARSINALRQDKGKSLELETLRKKTDESLREIEKLKKELTLAKNNEQGKEAYGMAVSQLQIKELIDKGMVLRYKSQYDDAIGMYTQAITLQPKNATAYCERGSAYFFQKKDEMALNDYNTAIELDPRYAPAYSWRGNLYSRQNKVDLAIADFNKVIEINPKVPSAYFERGKLYNRQSKGDLAIEDYKKAAQLRNKEAQDLLSQKGILW